MLKISQANKTFFPGTPDERRAINQLDLHLKPGDFAAVIGSNGAGKSSLLNAVAGKVSLDSGTLELDGINLRKLPVHKRASLIARVFQDPMMGTAPGMSVEENMLLAETRARKRRLSWWKNSKRKQEFRDRLAVLGLGLEDRMETRVDLLSGGQRQSVSLVMAVSHKPKLLLLDEHTAALDPKTAALVMDATIKAVDAFSLTTLMVTHNMQHAIDYGNRLLMMDSGRVKMNMAAEEKADLTVGELVKRFHLTDDKILLSD